MTDAGWGAIAAMTIAGLNALAHWSTRKEVLATKHETEQQSETINEIDRKADVAVRQNDGRLTKLEDQLVSVSAELAAAKTANTTLQDVIQQLVKKDPTAAVVVATVPPQASAEGGRRQGDAPKREPPA